MQDIDSLIEAKKQKDVVPTQEPAKPTKLKVQIHYCDEFNKTYAHHALKTKGVKSAYDEFEAAKSNDPNVYFGSKDYKFGNIYDKHVPGLKHAGLTGDKSVFYTLSGDGDTRHIHVYGIYGHDEAGIGQPQNINKQKSLAKKLSNQQFD